MRILHLIAVTAMVLTSMCAALAVEIPKASFGKTQDGVEVYKFTLKNKHGMEVDITNFGGIVLAIRVPDRNGKIADVALGFDNVADYEKQGPYFGALIGRYGNRIAKGQFTLDGHTYQIPVNNGPNSLHGGIRGFDKRIWEPTTSVDSQGQHLHLHYLSKDGEEGFPGNLNVDVVYTLTDKNEIKIDYKATTDKDTVANLTNHTYFNLKGQGEGTVLDHLMKIDADKITPVDAGQIPTGQLKAVAGTPFDFRTLTPIGKRIHDKDQQLEYGNGGYDINFVLNSGGGKMAPVAKVVEPATGRVLEVSSDQPGVQFYTGTFLEDVHGKGGKVYNKYYAFCLETQHFPDSPNHSDFPSTELKPGQTYHSTTIYHFSTEKSK